MSLFRDSGMDDDLALYVVNVDCVSMIALFADERDRLRRRPIRDGL